MGNDLAIRPAEAADFDGIWEIFHGVVEKGDTYVYDPATTKEEARALWMAPGFL
jgi:L-amino acid N-acyltransferase YncA